MEHLLPKEAIDQYRLENPPNADDPDQKLKKMKETQNSKSSHDEKEEKNDFGMGTKQKKVKLSEK